MDAATDRTRSLREAIASNRDALNAVLERYGASNPRLFGSVARGDASSGSDVDVLVDLTSDAGNPLLRIADIRVEPQLIIDIVDRELRVLAEVLEERRD